MMNDAHIDRVCVHYPGQEGLVWCDTLEEAVTYIIAENIGQGLSPFARLQNVKILKVRDDEEETQ
jgi:hypothetical protein